MAVLFTSNLAKMVAAYRGGDERLIQALNGFIGGLIGYMANDEALNWTRRRQADEVIRAL